MCRDMWQWYDKYIYTYIAEKFHGDVEWDYNKVKIATLDIECESENGFPEPTLAEEKVNAITIKPFGKNSVTFGIGPWDAPDNVDYVDCQDEAFLLEAFILISRGFCAVLFLNSSVYILTVYTSQG